MRFSEQQTCQFVSLLREHECLWNNAIDAYKHRQMRDAAFDAIVRDMDISDFNRKEAMNKLKSIKSTYHGEFAKIEKSKRSGMATENLYVPSMRWYHLMDQYMRTVVEKRDTMDNLEVQSGTPCESHEMETEGEELITSTPKLVKKNFTGQRKRKHAALLEAAECMKSVVGTLPTMCAEDEIDAFGRAFVLGLRRMRPDLRYKALGEYMAIYVKYMSENDNPPQVQILQEGDHIYSLTPYG